jgi:hypothetical protein
MIACGGSTINYSLILHGSGLYDFMKTMVCTVTPRIPIVRVGYTYNLPSIIIDTATFLAGASDIGGPAAISSVTTIYNMLSFSQALSSNIVGDQLNSAVTTDDELDVPLATSVYLGGVAEYAGTVFRACLSVTKGTFVDGVPRNMSVPSSGKLYTQFYGWEPSFPTGLALIPGLLVAFTTICLVLRAVWDHVADPQSREPFDPADTMHVVSASAVGGVKHLFTGAGEKEISAASDVHILLGSFEQKPAFITEHRTVQV